MIDTFYTANRQKLRTALPDDAPIIVTANGLLQRTSDNTFPFAQESNFWYLTGIELPDIILVIDGADEYLIVPGRSASRQAFDGEVDIAKLSAASGITRIYGEDDGWAKLGQPKKVQTPGAVPAYIDAHGMYVNPARGRLLERFKDAEIIDIRPQLARLRAVKQPVELKAIQKPSTSLTTALNY